MMPYYATTWNDTMSNLKLEVDNDNVDPTSPVGIGNLAGPPKPLHVSRFNACRMHICHLWFQSCRFHKQLSLSLLQRQQRLGVQNRENGETLHLRIPDAGVHGLTPAHDVKRQQR